MSKFFQKLDYYRKMQGKKIAAGWDTRAKSAEGDFPCVYMRINEFGTKDIPPRPALRLTSAANRKTWELMLKKGMQGSVPMDDLAHLVGARMRADIQATIISNVPPPNTPATVKAKAKKYRTQGTLRASLFAYGSVTYEVE